MSELQSYYENFRTGYWANPNASRCPCHGGGWALSEVDTWHQCPCHYRGQPHPEDFGGDCDDQDARGYDYGEEEALTRAPSLDPVPEAPASSTWGDDDIPF